MKKRRVLPLVLSTVMLSSLAPVQVFAAQNEIPDQYEKMYSITL